MCLVADDHRVQIFSVSVKLSCVDDFLLDKPEHQEHLRVRNDIVLICKQALKVKIYDARVRFQRGRRVPDIRIPPAYKFSEIQFRRAHIAQSKAVHTFLIFCLQRFEQIRKQREVLRFEIRAIRRFRDALPLIRFHDKVIDEFDHVLRRADKHDLEKALQHFQMRIERDDGIGGRALFREYLIDMERIDTPLLRVAHVDDVPFQISRKRQIFCFGIAYDHPCVVRPFV